MSSALNYLTNLFIINSLQSFPIARRNAGKITLLVISQITAGSYYKALHFSRKMQRKWRKDKGFVVEEQTLFLRALF
jgi:hypothetical protein